MDTDLFANMPEIRKAGRDVVYSHIPFVYFGGKISRLPSC
jgi:hypothetical protein